MKKAIVFVVLVMMVIGSLAAQSANDAQRLVGTWVFEYGDNNFTYVFNANGTGTINADGETYNIFWGISASSILSILVKDETSFTDTFHLSPDGRRMIYQDTVYQKK